MGSISKSRLQMQKQSLEIGIFNQKRFILLKGGLPHVQKILSNKHENVSFSFFLLPSSTSEKILIGITPSFPTESLKSLEWLKWGSREYYLLWLQLMDHHQIKNLLSQWDMSQKMQDHIPALKWTYVCPSVEFLNLAKHSSFTYKIGITMVS